MSIVIMVMKTTNLVGIAAEFPVQILQSLAATTFR
jgi:hypothetical protein